MAERLYTTVSRLRNEGVAETATLSDSFLTRRIKECSSLIERLTGQYFAITRHDNLKLSGRNSPLLFLPKLIPILKIESLSFGPPGFTPSLIPEDWYSIHNERFIARGAFTDSRTFSGEASSDPMSGNSPTPGFSEGYENYLFTGYSGWLEDQKELTVTLTEALSLDEIYIKVSSAVNFSEGDSVLVYSGADSFSAVVNSVDYTNNKLMIDKADTKGVTYAIGSTLVCFGRIPNAIVWACTRLVINASALLAPDATGGGGGGGGGGVVNFEARLKSEKTDNYSYTLFSPSEMNTATGTSQLSPGDFTGDPKIDATLATYKTPNIALGV